MAKGWQAGLKPVVAAAVCLGVANTSLFSASDPQNTKILAHRGLHQTYVGPPPRNDTCTASPIADPTHGFIENTLPSMAAAFDMGADVVEIDIHLTTDGQFAVFHDWTLDCRTNGTGQTNAATMATLKSLDVGWGYQTEDGRFALRGTGVGAIPSLKEVFAAFPDGQFLINFKSNNPVEGTELAAFVESTTAEPQIFGVYGGARPVETFKATTPDISGFTYPSVKRCLLWYLGLGWTSYVPRSCHNTQIMVPVSHARLFWGWPHRFTARMKDAGTDVILVGAHQGGLRGHTRGIDTAEEAARVPYGFDGYVWTNDLPAITAALP